MIFSWSVGFSRCFETRKVWVIVVDLKSLLGKWAVQSNEVPHLSSQYNQKASSTFATPLKCSRNDPPQSGHGSRPLKLIQEASK